ncbi:CBS domain-containing protein [Streptomyces telluris]|uniref:CBS domain-containing protein n=1 Tax=Streptomyces telluris TaxID=2720021 RepID=A0A9X2LGG8_9ACTN|nr:CBS domain-containing protein [Streptomyces telluris]MCQ8770529.1 CBS domain-containing protein [Streptomyces telluris]
MTTPAVTVSHRATAAEAAVRMTEEAVGCVMITDGDTLYGILTDRDLVVRGLANAAGPDEPVTNLMSTAVVTVSASDDVDVAYRLYRREDIRRLPVLDAGRLVGVLTVDDLFADALQRLADLLGPVSWSVLREQADRGPYPRPGL